MKKKMKKIKDLSKTKKVTAAIQSKSPNNFGRAGNDADRELETLRGMDRQKQMGKRRRK